VRSLSSVRLARSNSACAVFRIQRDGAPGAVHFGDALHGRRQHGRQSAELGQQRFRQRLGVLARDGAEEEELEQLVIGERACSSCFETLAQAAAMLVIVGLVAFDTERGRLGVKAAGRGRSVCVKPEREEFAVLDSRAFWLGFAVPARAPRHARVSRGRKLVRLVEPRRRSGEDDDAVFRDAD
jgi:hypothetical protein